MKKIIVEFSNERLITPSGLSLVGGALGKSDLVKRANRARIDSKRSQPQIKNGDMGAVISMCPAPGMLRENVLELPVWFV